MKSLKQGDTILNIDNNNKEVIILERNQNYCFLQCKDSAGNIHYNVGNVWIDRDKEVLNPGMINDENHYKRTREDIYNNWYLVGIADRDRKAEGKARAEAEVNENSRIDAILMNAFQESRELQKTLIEELRQAVIKSGSTKSVLKDKKAAIEQLTAVNTLINSGIYKRF